ncbi:hypothetical protein BLNAU_5586 [Blattamonas nauphoetae]|uniref:EF-hand domain-containing protein n=1 Tax=Blattamonas nauphoetae TaxID=2049346 RepID=A0ABQ9Y6Z8_9EUKA|nr:hypothetical protein BLNAU_5586 [Blattamonas nauphoetae]
MQGPVRRKNTGMFDSDPAAQNADDNFDSGQEWLMRAQVQNLQKEEPDFTPIHQSNAVVIPLRSNSANNKRITRTGHSASMFARPPSPISGEPSYSHYYLAHANPDENLSNPDQTTQVSNKRRRTPKKLKFQEGFDNDNTKYGGVSPSADSDGLHVTYTNMEFRLPRSKGQQKTRAVSGVPYQREGNRNRRVRSGSNPDSQNTSFGARFKKIQRQQWYDDVEPYTTRERSPPRRKRHPQFDRLELSPAHLRSPTEILRTAAESSPRRGTSPVLSPTTQKQLIFPYIQPSASIPSNSTFQGHTNAAPSFPPLRRMDNTFDPEFDDVTDRGVSPNATPRTSRDSRSPVNRGGVNTHLFSGGLALVYSPQKGIPLSPCATSSPQSIFKTAEQVSPRRGSPRNNGSDGKSPSPFDSMNVTAFNNSMTLNSTTHSSPLGGTWKREIKKKGHEDDDELEQTVEESLLSAARELSIEYTPEAARALLPLSPRKARLSPRKKAARDDSPPSFFELKGTTMNLLPFKMSVKQNPSHTVLPPPPPTALWQRLTRERKTGGGVRGTRGYGENSDGEDRIDHPRNTGIPTTAPTRVRSGSDGLRAQPTIGKTQTGQQRPGRRGSDPTDDMKEWTVKGGDNDLDRDDAVVLADDFNGLEALNLEIARARKKDQDKDTRDTAERKLKEMELEQEFFETQLAMGKGAKEINQMIVERRAKGGFLRQAEIGETPQEKKEREKKERKEKRRREREERRANRVSDDGRAVLMALGIGGLDFDDGVSSDDLSGDSSEEVEKKKGGKKKKASEAALAEKKRKEEEKRIAREEKKRLIEEKQALIKLKVTEFDNAIKRFADETGFTLKQIRHLFQRMAEYSLWPDSAIIAPPLPPKQLKLLSEKTGEQLPPSVHLGCVDIDVTINPDLFVDFVQNVLHVDGTVMGEYFYWSLVLFAVELTQFHGNEKSSGLKKSKGEVDYGTVPVELSAVLRFLDSEFAREKGKHTTVFDSPEGSVSEQEELEGAQSRAFVIGGKERKINFLSPMDEGEEKKPNTANFMFSQLKKNPESNEAYEKEQKRKEEERKQKEKEEKERLHNDYSTPINPNTFFLTPRAFLLAVGALFKTNTEARENMVQLANSLKDESKKEEKKEMTKEERIAQYYKELNDGRTAKQQGEFHTLRTESPFSTTFVPPPSLRFFLTVRFLFRLFDWDQDGTIAGNDAYNVLTCLATDVLKEDIERITQSVFVQFDEDGDGRLNYKDFTKTHRDTTSATFPLKLLGFVRRIFILGAEEGDVIPELKPLQNDKKLRRQHSTLYNTLASAASLENILSPQTTRKRSSSPFKFDPNSDSYFGRWRLLSPDDFDPEFYRRRSGVRGISIVIGENLKTGREEPVTIMFDRAIWSEQNARVWWFSNERKFRREWSGAMWKERGIDEAKSIPKAYRMEEEMGRREAVDRPVFAQEELRRVEEEKRMKEMEQLEKEKLKQKRELDAFLASEKKKKKKKGAAPQQAQPEQPLQRVQSVRAAVGFSSSSARPSLVSSPPTSLVASPTQSRKSSVVDVRILQGDDDQTHIQPKQKPKLAFSSTTRR